MTQMNYNYYCELYQKAEDIQIALDDAIKEYNISVDLTKPHDVYRYGIGMNKEQAAASDAEDEFVDTLDDAKDLVATCKLKEAIDLLEELCFIYSFIVEL